MKHWLRIIAAFLAIATFAAGFLTVATAARAFAQIIAGGGGSAGIGSATSAGLAAGTGSATSTSLLQQQIDSNTQQIAALNQEIATYQTELQQVGADKKTLQSAIHGLDIQRSKVEAQVALTERQITVTQLQISQLGGEITDTQQAIADDQAALGEYLRNLQKDETQPLFIKVLASSDLSQAWTDMNATLQMQDAIQGKMQALRSQQASLASSKEVSQQKQQSLTTQQQSLTTQQQSLTATVQTKSQLLVETNAKESVYQKLLADAESELQSFSAFTQNAGGSKLVGSQTQCDAWGCYYNQRDAAWGNDSLDGTRYTLASDGCLITSMAMVMTHYGYRSVTPVSINSNPGNFAAYYPAYLLMTINVNGITAQRKAAAIDATLATGNPVIVGVHAYGGTHYVVLVSGRRGNYLMRDPYVANGDNINFSDHYSFSRIFSVARVIVG